MHDDACQNWEPQHGVMLISTGMSITVGATPQMTGTWAQQSCLAWLAVPSLGQELHDFQGAEQLEQHLIWHVFPYFNLVSNSLGSAMEALQRVYLFKWLAISTKVACG